MRSTNLQDVLDQIIVDNDILIFDLKKERSILKKSVSGLRDILTSESPNRFEEARDFINYQSKKLRGHKDEKRARDVMYDMLGATANKTRGKNKKQDVRDLQHSVRSGLFESLDNKLTYAPHDLILFDDEQLRSVRGQVLKQVRDDLTTLDSRMPLSQALKLRDEKVLETIADSYDLVNGHKDEQRIISAVTDMLDIAAQYERTPQLRKNLIRMKNDLLATDEDDVESSLDVTNYQTDISKLTREPRSISVPKIPLNPNKSKIRLQRDSMYGQKPKTPSLRPVQNSSTPQVPFFDEEGSNQLILPLEEYYETRQPLDLDDDSWRFVPPQNKDISSEQLTLYEGLFSNPRALEGLQDEHDIDILVQILENSHETFGTNFGDVYDAAVARGSKSNNLAIKKTKGVPKKRAKLVSSATVLEKKILESQTEEKQFTKIPYHPYIDLAAIANGGRSGAPRAHFPPAPSLVKAAENRNLNPSNLETQTSSQIEPINSSYKKTLSEKPSAEYHHYDDVATTANDPLGRHARAVPRWLSQSPVNAHVDLGIIPESKDEDVPYAKIAKFLEQRFDMSPGHAREVARSQYRLKRDLYKVAGIGIAALLTLGISVGVYSVASPIVSTFMNGRTNGVVQIEDSKQSRIPDSVDEIVMGDSGIISSSSSKDVSLILPKTGSLDEILGIPYNRDNLTIKNHLVEVSDFERGIYRALINFSNYVLRQQGSPNRHSFFENIEIPFNYYTNIGDFANILNLGYAHATRKNSPFDANSDEAQSIRNDMMRRVVLTAAYEFSLRKIDEPITPENIAYYLGQKINGLGGSLDKMVEWLVLHESLYTEPDRFGVRVPFNSMGITEINWNNPDEIRYIANLAQGFFDQYAQKNKDEYAQVAEKF